MSEKLTSTESTSHIFPILSKEELKEREGQETNPDTYVISVYPFELLIEKTADPEDKYSNLVSGFVDFRYSANQDTRGQASFHKNIVWLGSDHYTIASFGAKFQGGQNVKDYIIGIKIKYDKIKRKLGVLRDTIGISCERDASHIDKILDAVDTAMNRDLIERDPKLQEKFFLKDHGLNSLPDTSNRQVYVEDKAVEDEGDKTTTSLSYDLALMSQMDLNPIGEPAFREKLTHKIEDILIHLKKEKGASIRIPFSITNSEQTSDEALDPSPLKTFVVEFEKTHLGTFCWYNTTRIIRDAGKLTECGYICIGHDVE